MSASEFISAALTVAPVALLGFLLIQTVMRKVEEKIETALFYVVARFSLYLINIAWWAVCGYVCFYLSRSA